MLSFLSWILFEVFCGIRMVVHDFFTQPKSLKSEDIKNKKENL